MTEQEHISVIYINAAPETVWQGLTDEHFTRQYFHSTSIQSDWQTGSEVLYLNPDESIAVQGRVVECNPPNRLQITWHVHYNPEAKQEKPSLVTFDLEAVEGATKLTVTHNDFPENSVVFPSINQGWIAILSNLKTLLETQQVMAIS